MVKGRKYRGILTLNPQSFEGRLEIGWAFRGFLPSGSEVWAEVRCGVQNWNWEVGAELGKGSGDREGTIPLQKQRKKKHPQDEYSLYVFPCPLTTDNLPSVICHRLTLGKDEDDQVQKKREGSIGVAKKFIWVFL